MSSFARALIEGANGFTFIASKATVMNRSRLDSTAIATYNERRVATCPPLHCQVWMDSQRDTSNTFHHHRQREWMSERSVIDCRFQKTASASECNGRREREIWMRIVALASAFRRWLYSQHEMCACMCVRVWMRGWENQVANNGSVIDVYLQIHPSTIVAATHHNSIPPPPLRILAIIRRCHPQSSLKCKHH